ncbi:MULTISPECIES: protein phosphatase 2C domain-containing protein [Streptomyces]|uniref:Protein phosphatase 2C domain-containing protein n=1 Tax=Streptomyces evansiae TaxID=3075535 RepID=A0ABU2R4S7_9ACTN|nr:MULTISPECIES: protein phosphatase 2C domain-containing protein [unclassified Streptomyces]MDT0411348.1 protein phosphatase 2C domain-containing protein [Streptomyces sp. DSM 41979]
MSQQGDARDDDWWDQLYEESAPDTGPDRAADTLDDRFASAIHTVKPPQEPVDRADSPPPWTPGPPPASPRSFAPAPPEPAAPWPVAERLSRPYVPGARPLPADAEDEGPRPQETGDNPPLPQRPLPREAEGNPPLPQRPRAAGTADSPPLPQRPPRRPPATPDGFNGWFGTSPERSPGETPPPPLPAEWTGVTPRRRPGPPVDGTGTPEAGPVAEESAPGGPGPAGTDERSEPAGEPARDETAPSGAGRGGPEEPVAHETGTTAEGTAPEAPPEPDEPQGFGPVRGEFARGASDATTTARDEPEPVRSEWAPPDPAGNEWAPTEPARSEWAPPAPLPSEPSPPAPVRDEPAPPPPRVPRHALPPSPPQRAEADPVPTAQGTPDQPPSPPDGPAPWQGAPPRTDDAATAPVPPLPPRPVPGLPPGGPAWPGTGTESTASPTAPSQAPVPPPSPAASSPASVPPPSPAASSPAPVPPPSPRAQRSASPGESARRGRGETSPEVSGPPAAPPVPYVGDRPPTYEAEPTALAESDPGALDAYVPDTVLEGGRFGGSTLRAVSQRGDSARYRGEARRDALLVVRFGAGEDGIVLVATATGARACPEAHRAATEAVRSIAAAVGRSHRRLADDIRAARRGDLKSGLHRLTDRTLGRLRAAAAERGLAPEEYTASLRCLLLPTDAQCRTRVFFGAGEGGLFRLRGGELRDIEPEVPTDGQPRSGPEAGALTLDPGIGRPPSPYAPVEEPRREPFRFHASIARSGDVLLLCGTGLAEPLRGSPPLASRLAEEWSAPEPPGLAAFLATSQTRVKGYADDRTLAAVWER